jgi:hypothetical protein
MGIEQKECFGIVFSFRKRLFIIKRFVVQEKILKFLTNNEKSNTFRTSIRPYQAEQVALFFGVAYKNRLRNQVCSSCGSQDC